METEDRYRAPALDKGLDILELLASVDGGLTQAEIAKHLDRSPNEFYRMLDRLVKRGYVTKLEGDRYSLTLKLFGLAHLHAPVRRLASFATPFMRELADRSRQANQLAVFDRGSVVVIAQQEAPDYWGISIRVGSHISLFDTGSGHVLLAFRSPEERKMMIAEYAKDVESVKLDQDFYQRLDQIPRPGRHLHSLADLPLCDARQLGFRPRHYTDHRPAAKDCSGSVETGGLRYRSYRIERIPKSRSPPILI